MFPSTEEEDEDSSDQGTSGSGNASTSRRKPKRKQRKKFSRVFMIVMMTRMMMTELAKLTMTRWMLRKTQSLSKKGAQCGTQIKLARKDGWPCAESQSCKYRASNRWWPHYSRGRRYSVLTSSKCHVSCKIPNKKNASANLLDTVMQSPSATAIPFGAMNPVSPLVDVKKDVPLSQSSSSTAPFVAPAIKREPGTFPAQVVKCAVFAVSC